jgi:DNA polymerase-3 subunit delta'
MAWSSIIGQGRVKNLLRASWRSGEIPGAYLMYGVAGTGKDALAIEFAKLLNCSAPSDEGSCGVCPSCKRATAMQHPNIKFICALPLGKNEDARKDDPISKLEPDALQAVKDELQKKLADPYYVINIPKAREIKLSSVRDIKKELSLSALGGKRVVIVSQAENMNTQSQNALLKTLEEPPANTVFILTSSARARLKPTILSRCQMMRCDALRTDEIADALVARANVERNMAELCARLGNGSYAAALQHCTEEFAAVRKSAVDFLRAVAVKRYADIYTFIEEIARARDRTSIEEFLSVLILWFRDAEALRLGAREAMLAMDTADVLTRFIERYPNARCDTAIRRIEKAASEVKRNVNVALSLRVLVSELQTALAG